MVLHQLQIQTTQEFAEEITTILNLFDAQAVTLQDAADDPLLEPKPNETPLWPTVWVKCIFNKNIDHQKIVAFLKKNISDQAVVQYKSETIAEQNWERAWLKDFYPMQFGKKLWICPSVVSPPDQTAINIILDPGLAFGTGTHPTTALCLEWLDANPPQNKTVIDYGCGSGILAIAALKLGAAKVYAIDYDEQALMATQENAQRNQIDQTKLIITSSDQVPDIQVDLLIANIIANPLIELAPEFAKLIKTNGQLVLSGILQEQENLIRAAYEKQFKVLDVRAKEEWLRIILERII